MKWFKHMSSSRHDEKISALEDRAGIEGYGFYFKVLEVVAEVMDASDNCYVTYSLSRWGRQLNITSKKFLTLSQCCHDVGLITLQRRDDAFTITVHNILKYRDNHTKNLQATCKQEKEKEKEKEKEEKEGNEIKPLAKIGKPICPHVEIISLYHEILPASPRIRDWTPARAASLKARWNEGTDRQTLDYWRRLFEYIAGIPFLTGKVPAREGRRPFVVSLDWLVKTENFAKVREGRYEEGAA